MDGAPPACEGEMTASIAIDVRCKPCTLLRDGGGSRNQFSFRKCRGTEESKLRAEGSSWCAALYERRHEK